MLEKNETLKSKVNYASISENKSGSKDEKDSKVMKRITGLENAIANISELVTRLREETSGVNRNKGYGNTQLNRCWYHGSDGNDISACFTF